MNGLVVLEEGTVSSLGDVDVGTANVWERDYVDAAGAHRRGLSARLDWELPGARKREVAGPGSVLAIGAARWEVVAVEKREGAPGRATLRRVDGAA